MSHRAVEEQVMLEHETLAHVVSALRKTVGWHLPGPDYSRKLSSLRFVGDSFERHLARLLDLEEADGYMAVVLAERPEMHERVKALHAEHDEFRAGVDDLLARLRAVSETDGPVVAQISGDLVALLDKLDAHHNKETDLLQEALLRDEGGEG